MQKITSYILKQWSIRIRIEIRHIIIEKFLPDGEKLQAIQKVL